MRKMIFFFLAVSLFTVNNASCQNDTDILSNEKSLLRKRAASFPSFYISYSYAGWQGVPANVDQEPNRNSEVNISKTFNLFKTTKHINTAIGASVSFTDLHSNVHHWRFDSTGSVQASELLPDTLNKHCMNLVYIGIPIEIKFKFGNEFNKLPYIFGIGAKINFLAFANQKTKDEGIKIREKMSEEMNRINFGSYAFFGYKFVGIYAGYNFNSLFKSVNSPEINYWSIGLSLLI